MAVLGYDAMKLVVRAAISGRATPTQGRPRRLASTKGFPVWPGRSRSTRAQRGEAELLVVQ
jgi:hypothetical protein